MGAWRAARESLGPLVSLTTSWVPSCAVRKAADGVRSTLLLAKPRPWFVRFFARWVDDGDAAEDLAQAALIRVWQALPRIRADRPVHYIVTIAMNLLRTAWEDGKRDDRRRATLKLDPPMVAAVTPDREAEDRDLTRLVHQLSLSTLSPELHEVGIRPTTSQR